MSDLERSPGPRTGPPTPPRREELRVVASHEILGEARRRVVIRHNGRDYVLVATRRGKLLLNSR